MKNIYDVAIIGGGPAGASAGIYCGRAELKTIMFEKFSPGGQMATTAEIENYPGFPKGTDAVTLAMNMFEQAKSFGVQSAFKTIKEITTEGDYKVLITDKDERFLAKTIILAMGANPKELGVPGENTLRGRGVSYCATCDGGFFKDKTVAVIGGGDTAAADALYLAKLCKKVYLIHRRDQLRAARIYSKKLADNGNVEIIWNTQLKEIKGQEKVSSIITINNDGLKNEIELEGVFVAVGTVPTTQWLKSTINLDKNDYILAGEDTKTNIEGVFAAGDCRTKHLRQVVTAVADGAVAATMAEEFISLNF